MEQQDFENALAYIDTAIAIKPEFSQFYYARGQILEFLDRHREAIEAYEHALQLKSYYPDVWKKLARLYSEAGQYEKSTQMLRNLTEFRPDSLQFELQLADAYLGAGKPVLALERVNYFEKRGGQSPEVHRIRGIAYYEQKNYSTAIQHLENYVRNIPEDFQSQKFLGIAYLQTNSIEKGMKYLNQALKLNPRDPEIYLYRAQYFTLVNKPDAAAVQYKLALQMDETSSQVVLEISKFYLTRGDTSQAEEMLQKAIVYDESCWECYKLLGIIADEQGKSMEALYFLEKYTRNIYHLDSEIEKRLEVLRNQ